jgi:hypothetical protein
MGIIKQGLDVGQCAGHPEGLDELKRFNDFSSSSLPNPQKQIKRLWSEKKSKKRRRITGLNKF